MTNDRGIDHGVFIPLKLMYPEADIPVVEISLLKGLDPKEYIKVGNALKKLNEKNLLFIGSGFSFHNMREFTQNSPIIEDSKNNEFQNKIIETCTGNLNYKKKQHLLENWKHFPMHNIATLELNI